MTYSGSRAQGVSQFPAARPRIFLPSGGMSVPKPAFCLVIVLFSPLAHPRPGPPAARLPGPFPVWAVVDVPDRPRFLYSWLRACGATHGKRRSPGHFKYQLSTPAAQLPLSCVASGHSTSIGWCWCARVRSIWPTHACGGAVCMLAMRHAACSASIHHGRPVLWADVGGCWPDGRMLAWLGVGRGPSIRHVRGEHR